MRCCGNFLFPTYFTFHPNKLCREKNENNKQSQRLAWINHHTGVISKNTSNSSSLFKVFHYVCWCKVRREFHSGVERRLKDHVLSGSLSNIFCRSSADKCGLLSGSGSPGLGRSGSMPTIKFTIPVPVVRQSAFYLTTISITADPYSLITDPNPDLQLSGFSVTMEELYEMYQVGTWREKLGDLVDSHLLTPVCYFSIYMLAIILKAPLNCSLWRTSWIYFLNWVLNISSRWNTLNISFHNIPYFSHDMIFPICRHDWRVFTPVFTSPQKRRCPTRRRGRWSSRRRPRRRPQRPPRRWVTMISSYLGYYGGEHGGNGSGLCPNILEHQAIR